MNFKLQKRLAKELLDVGESKIFIDSSHKDEIKDAITKADVRNLIKKGYIYAKKENKRSRARARTRHEQKVKGRRKGLGKRKGRKTARLGRKEAWMDRVRPQRELLKKIKVSGSVPKENWKKLYSMVKGGFFRSRAHLKLYIEKSEMSKKHLRSDKK
ncbi:MAG: 50S ribosomal protein L19e [Candidatus Nanoarchaeia archaeon]|nr:50S ribosomal protein L19e [Candidatus Nanoarchaeia archaeon]